MIRDLVSKNPHRLLLSHSEVWGGREYDVEEYVEEGVEDDDE